MVCSSKINPDLIARTGLPTFSTHKGKHGNWKVLPLLLSALTAVALDLLYWNGSTKGRGKRLNRNYWHPNTIIPLKYLINDNFLW